ncbi:MULTISPECIES: YjfB family protein [Paenibacillus]|uniref:YjfB family protein n=1 Tax=Paenibacillus TaxID=44249 RepID=UPI000364A3E5|nr:MULTISPECIES: YjfB family protein [Paenibacillus]
MDIPALSMAMSQASVAQAAGIQVMSLSKDMMEQQGQQMAQMLQQAPHPNLGKSLDIRA